MASRKWSDDGGGGQRQTWGSIFAAGITAIVCLSATSLVGGHEEVRTAAGGALVRCGTAQEQQVAVISGFVIGKVKNGDGAGLLESESGEGAVLDMVRRGEPAERFTRWVRFSNRKEDRALPKDRTAKVAEAEASRIAALSNISTHTVLSVTAHNERRQFNFWKRLRKTLEHEKYWCLRRLHTQRTELPE